MVRCFLSEGSKESTHVPTSKAGGVIGRRKRDAHLQGKRSEDRAIGSTFATPGKDNGEWSRKAGPTAKSPPLSGGCLITPRVFAGRAKAFRRDF